MAIIGSILQSVRKVSETKEAGTRISLQDELHMYDVPTISSDLVHTFQRATLCGLRTGIWRFVGPILRLLFHLCTFLSGATLFQIWTKYTTKKIPSCALTIPFIAIMGSIFGVIIGSTLGMSASIVGVLSIPLVAFLVINILNGAEHRYPQFARATSAWIIGRVNIRGYGASYEVPCVPSHLRSRISQVNTIHGTRVYVEYLEDDPFLVVVRGHFFSKEKVYIGAWETGNHHFDNI